ncbi:MAG: helix-turn-helix domain-containing protein [Gemmatimonadales bacterium]|nr:helix-turn-helix domain-containing protein [Gemmatimonadales bacterium]
MSARTRPRLGALLVESMQQAVAIDNGRLRPARRHRLTLRETTVSAPPRYGSSRVRRVRERLGLSQPVFARVLNVSVATVRGWEQGVRVPDGPSRRLLEVAERHSATILTSISMSRSRASATAAA